ncbi:hypothetical protein B0O99DRAFT_589925 [Bisporella sp. PMI_857]|nr:hypothetical protein B0O99DRAFT_589925 [Bisporella sp. PMI_857]
MTSTEVPPHSARSDYSRHSALRTRSQSISSDRPSLTGYGGLLSPPATVQPDPAFIAASAASQIVTNDHDSQAEVWFDQHGIEPSGETALVSPPALKLVNRFLDQLLFNFLSVSRSTSLASLRPAVGEVLKQKLSKEAINGADQELHEYLGGGEDEELFSFHNGNESSADWDLELVWKRTRLRCMVYSSLGDMEEEDEDYYTEQEHLDGPTNRYSNNNAGVVSPAVAIFLTSILEYMGEQVLIVAGQAAYHRLKARFEKEERDGHEPAEIADRVVVEEADMERVALDRTLGRLWRGWKKRIRSPTTSISMTRSFSRESMSSLAHVSRAASINPSELVDEDDRRPSLATVLAEHEVAAGIPLPMNSEDIREIEIPGLAYNSDDEGNVESDEDEIRLPPRPKSLLIFTQMAQDLPTPDSPTHVPIFLTPNTRRRSHSLPTPAASPYQSPQQIVLAAQIDQAHDAEAEAEIHTTQEPKEDGEPAEQKSLVSGVVASAVAMGTAAVAGIVAAAHGEAPTTSVETDSEYVEEFTEEPQIMTSSRMSIAGRISPDDSSAPSRESSSRSHSVHSLRVIEVSSTKTSSGSRTPPADTSLARSVSLTRSRPNSIHSPSIIDVQTPRIASPVSRNLNPSPLMRNSSSMSSKKRNSTEKSISEVEEKDPEDYSPPMTAVPSDLAAAMQGVDFYPSPAAIATPETIGREPKAATSSKPKAFVLSQPPPPRNANRIQAAQPLAEPQNPSANVSSVTESKHQAQAAPPRNANRIQAAQPVTEPQNPSANASSVTESKHQAQAAPPLTPLKETIEGAQGTFDEASGSHGPRSPSDYAVNGHSPSTSSKSNSQNQQRNVRPQATGIRNSPPRLSREEFPRKELPKNHRAIHTSGSSTSSMSNKLKPVRTSEESGPTPVEDKGRSFEQLIRSDQTIQYTLTPQNMRDIESPDSPYNTTQPVVVKQQDGHRPNTSRSHSSSFGKHAIPRLTDTPRSSKSSRQAQPISRPASNTGARLRPNAPQPRDARIDRESIGDFAEFIKSTGPTNLYDSSTARNTPINGHRVTNSLAQIKTNPDAATVAKLPRRAESSAGRNKLQARDAVVRRGDSISDLIDFVRSGPQLDNNSHRIPRTVAPFRTTMDSDQMSGAVGGKAIDANLPDPRDSQASASVNSSVGSQSALLNSTNKPTRGAATKASNFFGEEEEDMMPKRKTRRVQDMYQIDVSDEEEEYAALSGSKKKPPPQEESLADFLRNVPPPPDSSPAPLFNQAPAPAAVENKKLKKKSSTSGFMSRFRRDTGSSSHAPPKPKSSGHDSRGPSQTSASKLPTHTPIAVQFNNNYKPATYEPARSGNGNYISQVDSARNNDLSRPKVQQKSYQPREPVTANARTSDLANFLRDSEPPSAMHAQPQPFVTSQSKDESTFSRMRRKVY